MVKILVADRYSQESLVLLRQNRQLEVHSAEDLGDLKEHWETAEALLIRSGTKVTRDLLAKFPRVRAVITATSGFDHIDLEACQQKSIAVMHTPAANAQSAAEHAWGLILATQRRYLPASQQVLNGRWQRGAIIGRELSGQTLGIIGLGRIGKKVATFAHTFGMKVLVHDPYVDPLLLSPRTTPFHGVDTPQTNNSESLGFLQKADFLGYEEVVRKSDIVTFHVPLTSETFHMIKNGTLEWFHDDITIINTSRGDVVCMSSLLQFLSENQKAAVGFDVFPAEPLDKTSALLNHPQIFCTPHIGATTVEALSRASLEAVEKLLEFLSSGRTSDTLPPQTLWADKLITNKSHSESAAQQLKESQTQK